MNTNKQIQKLNKLTGRKLATCFQSLCPSFWTSNFSFSSCKHEYVMFSIPQSFICMVIQTVSQQSPPLASTSPSLSHCPSALPHQNQCLDVRPPLHPLWETNLCVMSTNAADTRATQKLATDPPLWGLFFKVIWSRAAKQKSYCLETYKVATSCGGNVKTESVPGVKWNPENRLNVCGKRAA